MIGLYYLPIPLICHEVGISEEGAWKGLASLSEVSFCDYDPTSEVVFVRQMAHYQIGDTLSVKDHRRTGVLKQLSQMKSSRFYNDFLARYNECFNLDLEPLASPLEAPCKPLPSQDQDQEQDKEKDQEKDQTPFIPLTGGVVDEKGDVDDTTKKKPIAGKKEKRPKRPMPVEESAQAAMAKSILDEKFELWRNENYPDSDPVLQWNYFVNQCLARDYRYADFRAAFMNSFAWGNSPTKRPQTHTSVTNSMSYAEQRRQRLVDAGRDFLGDSYARPSGSSDVSDGNDPTIDGVEYHRVNERAPARLLDRFE
jgi:hypothetical protein